MRPNMGRERDGDKVKEALREAILRLELRPGAILDEAGLSETLGVSRTPIREAIIQLVADGLAIRDGRSARVAPLDFDDVPKLHDAMLVSSRMIHRLAAANRTLRDLERIEAAMIAFEQGIIHEDGLKRSELNVDFHLAISAAAHNPYFQCFYEHVLHANIRLARACFSAEQQGEFYAHHPDEELEAHMAATTQQHREMLAAIRERDVDASDRLAVMHQKLAHGRLERILFKYRSPITTDTRLDLV